MSERTTVEAPHDGWAIGHLVVIAGPPAVGKSRLIRRLAEDDLLRGRLGVPKGTPDLLPRDVTVERARAFDALILHYDLLRLFNRGIPSYDCDPSLSLLDAADGITFLTLRTGVDRLRAQLEKRRIARPNRPAERQAYQQTLRTLYQREGFVRGWYDLWLDFVARYEPVTIGHSFVEVHEGYALTPVARAAPPAAGTSHGPTARQS